MFDFRECFILFVASVNVRIFVSVLFCFYLLRL